MIVNNSTARAALCGLLVLTLSACASLGKTQRSADEIVRDKAQQRWALLLEGKFEQAYELLSDGAKTLMSKDGYATSMQSRPVTWTDAQVNEVTCPAEESFCEVTVKVSFEVKSGLPGVGKIQSHSAVVERWVRSQGDWGFVPQEILRR